MGDCARRSGYRPRGGSGKGSPHSQTLLCRPSAVSTWTPHPYPLWGTKARKCCLSIGWMPTKICIVSLALFSCSVRCGSLKQTHMSGGCGPAHPRGVVYGDHMISSCCVTVKNIERCLYFLPREKVLDKSGHPTDEDVTFESLYRVSPRPLPRPHEVTGSRMHAHAHTCTHTGSE